MQTQMQNARNERAATRDAKSAYFTGFSGDGRRSTAWPGVRRFGAFPYAQHAAAPWHFLYLSPNPDDPIVDGLLTRSVFLVASVSRKVASQEKSASIDELPLSHLHRL
ncbi:MAG: hypothetical protein WB687_13045 [Candidatus Cybelea sp.]